jgi:hypothetical protein
VSTSFLDDYPALAARVDESAAKSCVTREQVLILILNRHFNIKGKS